MVTIMIVDDAAFMRTMLKNILENAGYKVITEATNGREAIEKYKLYRPDLVTMDLSMPEMGGIEALEGIIQVDPQAMVIMCSAFGHRETIINAAFVGAKDYILKPFNTGRLLDAIHRMLQPPVMIKN